MLRPLVGQLPFTEQDIMGLALGVAKMRAHCSDDPVTHGQIHAQGSEIVGSNFREQLGQTELLLSERDEESKRCLPKPTPSRSFG